MMCSMGFQSEALVAIRATQLLAVTMGLFADAAVAESASFHRAIL